MTLSNAIPFRIGAPRARRAWTALAALLAFAWSLCVPPAPALGADAPGPPGMGGVPAARQAQSVFVVTIEGEIDQWTSRSVKRRIAAAERSQASAIVFELSTPGGHAGAMLEICEMIDNCSIPITVAWINPEAYSAGAVIALHCKEIVVGKLTQTGDALPIELRSLFERGGLQEAERQKVLSPILRRIIDAARRNGYDEKLVQGFVTLGVELWLVENTETGRRLCIDEVEYRTIFGEEPVRTTARVSSGTVTGQARARLPRAPAPDREQRRLATEPAPVPGAEFQPASPVLGDGLVAELNQQLSVQSRRPILTQADRGRWRLVEYVSDGGSPLILSTEDMLTLGVAQAIVQNDEGLKQFFGATALSRADISVTERFARFMTSRPVQLLLIAVFLIALFVEMAAPGVGFPGAIAGLALVGLVAPQFMVGAASWWSLIAIGLGLALIALELFVFPGFGAPGVIGVISLFAGLVGLTVGPAVTPGDGGNQLLWGVATVLMAFFTAGIGVYFVTKHYGSLPLFNKFILTSEPREEPGTMLGAMNPAPVVGPVRVGDRGVATTPLRPAGTAQFGDDLVDVVCEFGFADKGAEVRVAEVGGYRVVVHRVLDDAGQDGPAGSPQGGGDSA